MNSAIIDNSPKYVPPIWMCYGAAVVAGLPLAILSGFYPNIAEAAAAIDVAVGFWAMTEMLHKREMAIIHNESLSK